MNGEELEKVLSRVAELIDTKKSELIRMFQCSEEDIPSSYLKLLTKGELIAEIVYYEFHGTIRNRLSWYEDNSD